MIKPVGLAKIPKVKINGDKNFNFLYNKSKKDRKIKDDA